MNLYLCSTIRHLLFSLLKSLLETDRKHIVIMISDQQEIDENNYNKSQLPEHIQVIFIKRQVIREKLYSGFIGKTIKLIANLNLPLPNILQLKLANMLFNNILTLSLSNVQLNSTQLFLFNDRNKMSRLFRLIFRDYFLIEEGLANYGGIKLKLIEKITSFFSGIKRDMRYFGDDKRCKSIYLIDTDKAPNALRSKVKAIDFINTNNIQKYCLDFFKIHKKIDYDYILATQPLEHTRIDMKIYQKIIAICLANNITIAIKPHPQEDIERYKKLLPQVPLIESKVPLELSLFGSNQKKHIFSIYSTAGMGFEKYCTRHNVIKDDELEKIKELTVKWQQNIDLVDERILKIIESTNHC